MMLDWPTFVLQRRVNHPLDRIERILCAPGHLRSGDRLPLGADALALRVERPFSVAFPPFGVDGTSWTAPATVEGRRDHALVKLEIEVNRWDTASTELVVRPRARHPHHWSGRRLRRYFHLAHLTADHLTGFLGAQAVALPPDPAGQTRIETVGSSRRA